MAGKFEGWNSRRITNDGGLQMRQGTMVVRPFGKTRTQSRAESAFLHERHKNMRRRPA